MGGARTSPATRPRQPQCCRYWRSTGSSRAIWTYAALRTSANEVLDVIQRAGYFGSVPIPGGAQPGQQVPEMPTAGAPLTGMPYPAAPSPAGDDPDPTVRLTKLAELRNAGTITAAEFEEHKRRILSDI